MLKLVAFSGVGVTLDPELCLLGNLTSVRGTLKNAQLKFILIVALYVSKKCIAASWESDSPLLIDRWSFEMNSCILLEKNDIFFSHPEKVSQIFVKLGLGCTFIHYQPNT